MNEINYYQNSADMLDVVEIAAYLLHCSMRYEECSLPIPDGSEIEKVLDPKREGRVLEDALVLPDGEDLEHYPKIPIFEGIVCLADRGASLPAEAL